jgi:flagella basal body P-ring formation protein FlgA
VLACPYTLTGETILASNLQIMLSNEGDPIMKFRLLAGLAAVSIGTAATAANYQDLGQLEARIAASLAGSGTPTPIDRRIKLAACPEEPEISGVIASAVSVRCRPLGWRIRVGIVGAPGAEVAAEPLVHRGDSIELVAQGRGYSATTSAVALDEGAAGHTIRVKIPTSSRPVSAVVTRAGVVTVTD